MESWSVNRGSGRGDKGLATFGGGLRTGGWVNNRRKVLRRKEQGAGDAVCGRFLHSQKSCDSYIYVRYYVMKGNEFVKRVRQAAKARGVSVRFVPHQGKGSHGRLYYGNRFTTVKDRKKELGRGLLQVMLNQLGLKLKDIQ